MINLLSIPQENPPRVNTTDNSFPYSVTGFGRRFQARIIIDRMMIWFLTPTPPRNTYLSLKGWLLNRRTENFYFILSFLAKFYTIVDHHVNFEFTLWGKHKIYNMSILSYRKFFTYMYNYPVNSEYTIWDVYGHLTYLYNYV